MSNRSSTTDMASGPFRIEALRKDHQRQAFDCGHPFLDTYLRQFARQNDQNHLSRAYVLVPAEDRNPVIGYYTLSAGEVAFDVVPPSARSRLPRYPVPVARIGELAVDRRHQDQGLGSMLLIDALRRILAASAQVAVWAVLVDPIDMPAVSFYQRFGFEALRNGNALFLPLQDAAAWLD